MQTYPKSDDCPDYDFNRVHAYYKKTLAQYRDSHDKNEYVNLETLLDELY